MMPTISKYIGREITRHFGVVLSAVVGIYLVVDFLEKIDDFVEAGLSTTKAARLLLYKVPFIIAQIAPVGILLSVLIVFGLMNRHREVVALKAGGYSIFHLLKPVLATGMISAVTLFFMAEMLVPITMHKANKIWYQDVRREVAVASREKNIWIKGDRLITYISHYDHRRKTLYGVTLSYFDGEFSLVKRVDAPSGVYLGDGWWILIDAMVQQLAAKDGAYAAFEDDRWVAPLDFQPDDVSRAMKKSEEMGLPELLDYIGRIESEGYDASFYRVDLQNKIAYPFVCLVMSMIAAGIALRGELRDGLPVSISYGIGVAFVYYVMHTFSISLGYGGILPPIIAAWAANLLLLCFGGILLLNAE